MSLRVIVLKWKFSWKLLFFSSGYLQDNYTTLANQFSLKWAALYTLYRFYVWRWQLHCTHCTDFTFGDDSCTVHIVQILRLAMTAALFTLYRFYVWRWQLHCTHCTDFTFGDDSCTVHIVQILRLGMTAALYSLYRFDICWWLLWWLRTKPLPARPPKSASQASNNIESTRLRHKDPETNSPCQYVPFYCCYCLCVQN